ncbi:hypothetical protein Mapa_007954 [Marchantia paleacea]|nr:hypothetical protein Mapa_007954 [Marchantia paleacea]
MYKEKPTGKQGGISSYSITGQLSHTPQSKQCLNKRRTFRVQKRTLSCQSHIIVRAS